MNKLAVIVTCVDAQPLANLALQHLAANTTEKSTIFLLDNGSQPPLECHTPGVVPLRMERNIGGNAVFHATAFQLESMGFQYVAYLHCDMMVLEPGWDLRVMQAFQDDPDLALLGFVGSHEIDENGGRGGGTVLNYQGHYYDGVGQATTAEQHGIRMSGLKPAAVLDHCSMIFRLTDLQQLPPQPGNYAPGHFYDRICCAELLHRGKHVAVLGIACDHFSGGIAGGMPSQLALYKQWLMEEGLPFTDDTLDQAVYVESERRFLTRYRDDLQLIPCRVNDQYGVTHFAWNRTTHRWEGQPYGKSA